MFTYELALMIKVLPKAELGSILKRTANSIFEKGGFIRRIDNLGHRKIPYKTNSHGAMHKEANYFVIEFNAPPSKLSALTEEYGRDIDVIRSRIYKMAPDNCPECTLEEEMKPAPYRAEVIKLVQALKRKERKNSKFSYNTGITYYPFQK